MNLAVEVAGIRFKNPLIAASGTFGYGVEYEGVLDLSVLGGIVSKGLYMEPRDGAPTPRIVETPSGLLNAIGLQGVGVRAFVHGVWNETGTSIKVTILPPWWRTNWAYAGYILLIGLAINSTWYLQMRRLRIKHQLEIEHLQASNLQEIDRVKSRFFANISHEFRTPLTLILGPLEKMLHRTTDEGSREDLGIMQRSALRLHQLINQLLVLSKLEAGKMKLQAREVNLAEFLKPVILAFASWAETKKISLTFIPSESPIILYIDPEMMEKVMNNLLSNALKFTPEGGQIDVSLRVRHLYDGRDNLKMPEKTGWSPVSKWAPRNNLFEESLVEITVSDTGPGIPIGDKQAIEPLFSALKDSEDAVRGAACLGLGFFKDPSTFDEIANVLLDDQKIEVRQAAARSLGSTQHPAALPYLMEALNDPYWWYEREYAAGDLLTAIEKMGSNAVDELIEALKDKEGAVRKFAAILLGKIGHPRAIEPLGMALYDVHHDVGKASAEALVNFGVNSFEILVEALDHPEMWIRIHSVDVLPKIKEPCVALVLLEMLKDPEREVKKHVIEAMGELKDKRTMPALQEIMAQRGDRDMHALAKSVNEKMN